MQSPREQRHREILALLGRHRIRSQADLQARLARRGKAVNQATLSRDLRDLGLRKGPQGYELPLMAKANGEPAAELARSVREWLVSAVPVRNQIVLHTPPSGAPPLALALDHARWPKILGTLAGDDTVLVICADAASARRVCRQLLAFKEQSL